MFSIHFKDVDLIKLLSSQFDMLMVKLIKVLLQLGQLLRDFFFSLDVRLHFFILQFETLFIDSLLSV